MGQGIQHIIDSIVFCEVYTIGIRIEAHHAVGSRLIDDQIASFNNFCIVFVMCIINIQHPAETIKHFQGLFIFHKKAVIFP